MGNKKSLSSRILFATLLVPMCLVTAWSFGQERRADRVRPTTTQRAAAPAQALSQQLAVPVERVQNQNAQLLSVDRAVQVSELAANPRTNVVLAERTGRAVRKIAPSATSTDVLSKAAFALPIKFRALAIAPGQTAPVPIDFEAIVVILGALQFHDEDNAFSGELAVGLRNQNEPKDRSVLVEPVKLLISAEGARTITPQNFEIKKLNDPVNVRIAASQPVKPFKVTARTLLDDGDTIEMPILPPKMTIAAARTSIEGWGLGKTPIHLNAPGLGNGKYSVTLRTNQGDVTHEPLQFRSDGWATGEIRSEGTGKVTVIAAGAPMDEVAVDVYFDTPWKFGVAVTIGAVLGWFVRTRGRSKSIRSLGVAIASALILATAYMIGIRWAEWAPDAGVGEALAFFLGAAGAYLGVQVLFPKVKAS